MMGNSIMARFTKERLAQFEDVDDILNEFLSSAERAENARQAVAELEVLKALQEAVRDAVIDYLTKEAVGVPAFTTKMQTSTRQAYKILNAEANVTLATIAALAQVIGKRPKLVFE